MSRSWPLIEARNLSVHYPDKSGRQGKSFTAVNGLSFTIEKGETLGLVGESGSGKSSTGRALLGLEQSVSGQCLLDGVDLLRLSKVILRRQRRRMQMIFQDPYASLNPRRTAAETIAEPLLIHRLGNRQWRRQRVAELLDMVGLTAAQGNRLPHEFSGGQRQRIGIARALASAPDFVVCDEAIAALDVSIQAQIINLLLSLQQQLALTFLFISHDLAVVRHVADRIAVMYRGRIVELLPAAKVPEHAAHPYTQLLLSAIPEPTLESRARGVPATAQVVSAEVSLDGCAFAPRCQRASAQCWATAPDVRALTRDHWIACHHPE